MSVEMTHVEIRSPEVTDRTHAKLMRESLSAIAQHHRLVTMGKHFKKNAETAPDGPYGYVARNPRYESQKLKRFGTDAPNVRTKKLMRWTRNNSRVTATQHRSRLYIKAPFPLTEQRRKELESITRDEIRAAQQLATVTYQELVSKPENMRQRRKRVK